MFRLQLFSLLSLLTLLSVPVLAQESAQEAATRAQEAAEKARELARPEEASSQSQTATGSQATVSGSTRVTTETTTVRTTDLSNLECAELTEQYEVQEQNYLETTETIEPLLTKFESYVEETLAVSRDNAGLLEAYTTYNLSKVEYQSDAVRTQTSYRFLAELDCGADRDTYAGELTGVLQVQADQADAYTALLDNLQTTYNSLN